MTSSIQSLASLTSPARSYRLFVGLQQLALLCERRSCDPFGYIIREASRLSIDVHAVCTEVVVIKHERDKTPIMYRSWYKQQCIALVSLEDRREPLFAMLQWSGAPARACVPLWRARTAPTAASGGRHAGETRGAGSAIVSSAYQHRAKARSNTATPQYEWLGSQGGITVCLAGWLAGCSAFESAQPASQQPASQPASQPAKPTSR